MISRRSFAIVSVIVLMILWGSTFVVTKTTAIQFPPLTLAVSRYLIASCVLFPIVALRSNLKLPPKFQLASLSLMGLSGIALFTIGFNYALVYASASQGALIFALVPAAVAIASVFSLKETLPKRRVFGIILSIFGVAIIILTGEKAAASPKPLLGAICMLGAVISWAVYTVFAKRLAGSDQISVIAWVSLIGTILLLPLGIIELSILPFPNPSMGGWLGLLFLGVFASAIAFVMYGSVLRELDASVVGAYINLDPIIGVLTAVIFLGEKLHGPQILGGMIALIGMWLASKE